MLLSKILALNLDLVLIRGLESVHVLEQVVLKFHHEPPVLLVGVKFKSQTPLDTKSTRR